MSGIDQGIQHMLIDEENEGERLDSVLAEELEGVSRTLVQGLIKEGRVRLNGQPAKASARLKGGDIIAVELPPPQELRLLPEDIPLDII
ncbi:MAG: S4 domain-containing protein, partial [Syntrophomonadaceae bacterium]|nr:S4 domain-containing protein [Syntrophomonadaceae bacterium]